MNSPVLQFLKYLLVPRASYRNRRKNLLASLPKEQQTSVERRVEYYNRLSTFSPLTGNVQLLEDFHYPYFKKKRLTPYFLDLYETLRYYPGSMQFLYLFGDVIHVPDAPTFVKSRPIHGNNNNSVLLKLNQRRHFRFIQDNCTFSQKKDMLVSRTTWAKPSPQRTLLNRMFLEHPMCNVGKTMIEDQEDFPESVREFLSIPKQLEYKFIACIEGGDVATNLKWVMSSNSIAVMPRPIYETWFMEGTLRPDYHYIEVAPDFSDLIEKITYYTRHQNKAQDIIDHAHEYIAPFKDEYMELIVCLRVAEKYFHKTQQL